MDLLLRFIDRINILRLIPTFFAFFQAPRHLFRRMTRQSQVPLYASPVDYLWYSALFVGITGIGLDVYARSDPRFREHVPSWAVDWARSQSEPILVFIVIGLGSLASIMVLPLAPIIPYALKIARSAYEGWALKTLPRLQAPDPSLSLYKVPLRRESYRNLDRPRALKGGCYFCVTAIVMWTLIGGSVLAGWWMLQGIVDSFQQPAVLPPVLLVPLLLIPATLAERLLVSPYVEMLRSTQSGPSKIFIQLDVEPVAVALDQLAACLELLEVHQKPFDDNPPRALAQEQYHAENVNEVTDKVGMSVIELEAKLAELRFHWRNEEFDYRHEPSDQRSKRISLRAEVFRRLVNTDSVESLMNRVSFAPSVRDSISEVVNSLKTTT